MENLKRVTNLPVGAPIESAQQPLNPARDLQNFVGEVMSVVTKPIDLANLGVAKLTQGLADALPSFPAARLFRDVVLGWPHSHPHAPTFGLPLPSFGVVICAGATNVLINGLPAARNGDVGFGAWCGGYYPLFEVFTGSSNVFIGGARAARQFVDFTKHCLPAKPGWKAIQAAREGFKGLTKLDKAIMALPAVMGALGAAAALTDYVGYQEQADSAESVSDAKEAAAKSEAAGKAAAMAVIQAAADVLAMALSVGMGKDPGITPLNCWGNFITGSANVLIGGFPMPGWMSILRGMRKLLKRPALKIQLKLPAGSRLRRALCLITGHPVDIASGRVFTTQTDFELLGRIPIEFTRTYDSSAVDYEGPMGRGWMSPYDVHLWEDDGQRMVILRNEEGRLAGFDPIEVGEKAFNPLEKQWLERLDDKAYVVSGKDGLRYKFTSIREQDSAIEAVGDRDGKSEATALKLSEIEDRNGNHVRLFYEGGRLSRLIDTAGARLNFSYITFDDGAARLAGVSLALDEESTRTARLVNFTYDSEGRLTNATDRGLVPWRYAYDRDLLIRETNRNGLSFHFAYKGEGKEARCMRTWGDGGIYERWLDYDHEAKMTVVEDSLGRRKSYYFNELHLPVRIVDALGGEERFSYGSNGELLSDTDQIGRETKYLYNAEFDLISVTRPDGTMRSFAYNSDSMPERMTDEAGAEFRLEHDERGNLTATVDALGHRREYSYNRFGDLERAVDPLGGATRFKWNEGGQIIEFRTPGGATTRYGYDERGRLVKISDPLGNAARYTYDAVDRLAQVERPDGSKHRYEYDPEGNLTNFRDANGAETRFRYVDYNKLGERIDALGYTRRFIYDTEANLVEVRNERGEAHRFVYDALDRVTREVGFDGLRWEYDYDLAGQLIARSDPAGRVTRLIRDLLGRVIERRRPDGSAINFSYDRVGRLTEADAPGSELEFRYDALGRVIWEAQNGQVIEHEYDALGRRIKRRSPSGRTVEFTYDADHQLSRLQTPRGVMEFEYDKAGRIAKRRMPGELEESFYYDRCGRIIEQSLHKPSHTLFLRGYKYDTEGALIELSDSRKGTSRFAYDTVERLREATRPEKELERFVYDSTGNLLRRGEREFRYGQPDRLTKTDNAALIYDEVGNLIEKRRAGSVIRYSYDTDNRLIAVESKEGGRIEFAYDAFGRRIAKTTKDGGAGFLWDGDVLLAEERGARSNEYIFEAGSFAPLCRFDGEGFEAYHNDHLGTPQELTDERGQLVWSATYDVYGQISKLHSNDVENPLRFQGQYEDYETTLRYNFNRYFDSENGRYISKDPIGLAGGINPYEYTHNTINWVDPLGLTECGATNGGSAGYTKVFRFAARTNPSTLRSNLSRANWFTQARVKFLMKFDAYRQWRAHRHMRGDTRNSPFVSVVTDPAKLATSTDPWARTIVTGHPGLPGVRRAPDLGSFEAPASRLFGPRHDNLLSIRETEMLFHGDDLEHFLVRWDANPY
jgi:RHS repeat-associated protein